MFNHSSAAQALPIDILRSILKWVVKEERSPLVEASCNLQHLKELRLVSSTWRQAALEYLWQELNFTIGSPRNKVSVKRPKWVKNNRLPHYATSQARKIHVHVSMSSIVSGDAQALLVDYIRDTTLFPLVSKLTVEIMDFDDQHHVAKDIAISNALEFAKLLRSMAPQATTVKAMCTSDIWIRLPSNNNHVEKWDGDILEPLADVLYANTKRAHIDLSKIRFRSLSPVDHIPPLSMIKISWYESPDIHASLVRKSANSLQYLNIETSKPGMIIYDTNGEAVIFPNLQHLQLSTFSVDQSVSKNTITRPAPFPVLKTLRLRLSYPFTDDVVFRGNSTTLEYLEICLDYETFVMLNREQVFEGRYNLLRHVNISWSSVNWDTSGDSEADGSGLLNNLVYSAQRLVVFEPRIARACVTAAQHGQGFQNLKVFGVRAYGLSVFEIMCLLKSLPALVELRSSISGPGPKLEHISAEELPGYIASTYCEVGKNLQVWRINSNSCKYTSAAIDYILLLVLVCPTLWRIQLEPDSILDSHVKIAKALESSPYSKYAPQLNRTLDIVRE